MDVSDAKRLKALEDENAKLKKLLADQMLEASVNGHRSFPDCGRLIFPMLAAGLGR
jgi:hypothetical protein